MGNEHYVRCDGCYYWKVSSYSNKGMHFCHYCYLTGIPRGISPKDCYKKTNTPYITTENYKKQEKGKKEMANMGNYDAGTKEAAVKAVLVDKEPQSIVRERFCIAPSTLARWVADAKKEQKIYFDYAEKVEAEQSRAEQSRAEQSRAEQSRAPSAPKSGKEDAKLPAEKDSGDMYDEIADGLCNAVSDIEGIMRKLEKLEIVSEGEKQVLERLFARVNGFILGLDYRRGRADGK